MLAPKWVIIFIFVIFIPLNVLLRSYLRIKYEDLMSKSKSETKT
jgi:hypothetical protein